MAHKIPTPTYGSPSQQASQFPQQEHQMARRTSNGSRRSSLALSTRRSSRADSRQAGASGGVLGLPGSVDDFLDPSLLNEHVDYDSFLDMSTYNGTESYLAYDPANNWPVNGLQDTNMIENSFNLNLDSGLRISIPPTPIERVPHLGNPFDPTTMATYRQPYHVLDHSGHNRIREHEDTYNRFPGNDYRNTQPLDFTTGLAAIPGGQKFSPELPLDLPKYPDPSSATYSKGPYFKPPVTQYSGYAPVDLHSEEWDADRNARRPRNEDNTTTQLTDKRKRIEHESNSEPENEAPPVKRTNKGKYTARDLDSESEDEAPRIKRKNMGKYAAHDSDSESGYEDEAPPAKRKIDQARLGGSRRDSNVSESSSLAKPMQVKAVRPGEKPKKCEDKSWIRINNTTRGETTRTARINKLTDGGKLYKSKPLPLGNWEVKGGYRFEYTTNDGMHEFSKRPMSTSQIYQYITQYPEKNLRIWIQVTPGDSARRYASKSHSECIFRECPNRVWANKGTIEVGNYRVAFDEKHKQYGKGAVDPFDCVGYAHLYCMERFLDFAGICRHADVKVDTRNDMKKEPKGEPAFAFSKKHVPERMLAEKFIKAAKLGRLRETPEFSNYPVHKDYETGDAKPHKQTLTFAMFSANWEHRPRSQLKQFLYRTVKPTSCGIHRGDQEIMVADKMVESTKAYKKAKKAGQHKNFDYATYYDKINPDINIRIAQCTALRAQYEKEDAQGLFSTRKKQQKRQLSDIEDSDDDKEPVFISSTRNKKQEKHKRTAMEDFDDEEEDREFWNDDDDDDDDLEEIRIMPNYPQRVKPRSSPRKKQRVNYTEPELQDILPGLQNHAIGYPQSDTIDVQTSPVSPKTRKSSTCSRLFEAAGTQYTIPDEIDLSGVANYTQDEIDVKLERRKSSTAGPKTSIMKSPELTRNLRSPQTNRTASFDAQPVTSSKEYNVNDPPRRVATPARRRRSSIRLASK